MIPRQDVVRSSTTGTYLVSPVRWIFLELRRFFEMVTDIDTDPADQDAEHEGKAPCPVVDRVLVNEG